MTRFRRFAFLWLPVLAWMALIFVASADPDSGPRGSRLLAPLIRWLTPEISPDALDRTVLVARKVIHVVTFGALAGLVWRALTAGRREGWRWRTAGMALAVTVAYAISDEIHQGFVPPRVGSAGDVLIDTLGAITALVVLRAVHGRRRAA